MIEFCGKAIAYLKEPVSDDNVRLTVFSDEPDAPILKKLECGLCVAYVVDQDDQLVFIQNRHLSAAGLTVDELHQIAMDNLLKLAHEKMRIQNHGPIFGVILEGNFEVSLILLDKLWDVDIAHTIKNNFMIAIPNRDILAFCDSKSEQGVATLREIVRRAPSGDHPVSNSLYERIDGSWSRLSF